MNNQIMKTEENTALQTKTPDTKLGVFADSDMFNNCARMADAMSKATIVPRDYQGNPGNCMIAIDTASRMGISPMMVMQNLYIVNGRPAWSSQWIIAAINASGKYTCDLQFEYGYDKEDGGLSCIAWAMDRNGNRVCSPKITMNMAKAEGWSTKNGSKWQTMPEVMISYRAASFFGRRNCPEITLGIYAEEEAACIPADIPTKQVTETVPSDTVQTEVIDDCISKEDARQLIAFAANSFGGTQEEYSEKLKRIMQGYGYKKTLEIKKCDLAAIKADIEAYCNAVNEEIPVTDEVNLSDL